MDQKYKFVWYLKFSENNVDSKIIAENVDLWGYSQIYNIKNSLVNNILEDIF